MGNNLRYVEIDRAFKDIDRIEEIYNNSFPPSERFFTVRQALEMMDKMPVVMTAIYDGDVLVGFYVITEKKEYSLLHYFAVDQSIRSKGYGGEIIRKLLDDNADKVFFGFIEKPISGGDNYEIKLSRQQFYERNGMIIVYTERTVNGMKFITVTNKTGEEFEGYYKMELEEEKRVIEASRKDNAR